MYTRYAAILLCIFQSGLLAKSLADNGQSNIFLKDFSNCRVLTHTIIVFDLFNKENIS